VLLLLQTKIINGVLGIIAQFYQVYGIGVGFAEDDIRFTTWIGTLRTYNQIIQAIAIIAALEKTGAGNRARVDGGGWRFYHRDNQWRIGNYRPVLSSLWHWCRFYQSAGPTLDLTSISNTRIQDIEIIDIRGSGDNTLKLNLNDGCLRRFFLMQRYYWR
jgi:hypothetical protein